MFKDTENYEPKLIDFGLSTVYAEAGILQSIIGTPIYLAPEVKSNYFNFIIN